MHLVCDENAVLSIYGRCYIAQAAHLMAVTLSCLLAQE